MEYKYYKEVTGELVRVHIEQDTTPENPRYDWDGNIGHMMCWHRNYQLGDYKENSYSDNLDFLNNLLRARVSESTILNFVKNHRAANFLTLDYDRHKKVWVLGQELRHEIPNFRVIEENEKKEWLVDAVIDALLQADKWRLLERHAGIVYLPLFLYDQYLTGQVYGIITEEFDTDTGTWEEQDSCWGYFSDKWGDDLIEEIASEYGITEELHDKAEAA
ncbi:hypothetical protein [Dorea longicatena]|uniref:hypothetical protein n=1 Tax=Dorea longicatena TaxID=88431 RepID=UPI0022E2187B|nr:hypothetical protein [Dorea longicatena]